MICYHDLFAGCVENGDDALQAAQEIGFPVMICYPDLFVGCVENVMMLSRLPRRLVSLS